MKRAGMAGGAVMMAGLAGPIGAASSQEERTGDGLLKGVCDIHIHAAPDVKGRCVDLGAYIEYCYLPRVWGAGTAMAEYERQSAREFIDFVSVEPERSFISTDMGQEHMPDPSEGMRACIKELQDNGFSQQMIDRLVQHNPAHLVGLE